MFRGIFNKRGAATRGKRNERGPSVVPAAVVQATAKKAAAQADVAPRVDIAIDDSLVAVSRELSGLARVQVPRAAKERGWSSLQRELERRPVRSAAPVASGGKAKGTTAPAGARQRRVGQPRAAHSRGFRWALASAAGVIAVVAALLGTYSGGLLQTADNDTRPTTVSSVVSSDSTEPVTTVTTTGPVTTDTQPGTTQATDSPGSTGTTGGSTVTTEGGSGGSTVTTQPSGTVTTKPSGTATTQPPRTTTTGGTQNAASQIEGSAKAAAVYLANVALTGDASGARSIVVPQAQASLAWMMMSLNEPYGYRVTGAKALTSDTARVTLDIDDRVVNSSGEVVETVKHFAIQVRVGADGAVITAINAGS